MIVIEAGCHVEAPRHVVSERIRSVVEDAQPRDEVDRAFGRFMGADGEPGGQPDDVDYTVTTVGEDSYRVEFREPPYAGTAVFDLESVDAGASTVVEARIELNRAPSAVRFLARLPGGRAPIRRVVQHSLEEWLGESDTEVPAAAPPVIPHDPTRPAWDEPEVRHAVRRSTRWIALGWIALCAVAVYSGIVISSIIETEARLDAAGAVVDAVVEFWEGDDGDGAWVEAVGEHDGVEVRHEQPVVGTYSVGDAVVLLHDPASGQSKLRGEDYAPENDFLGYGTALAAVLGAVLLIDPTYRVARSRRTLRQHPFEQVEIGIRPPVARSHGSMVALFEPGDRVRVFGAPVVAWPGRTERVLDELEQGCLMAGAGRDRVLWKPGLGRVVRIAESRFAWRNARWRDR